MGKVEGPTQRLTFLGIEIDTVRDLLVLPEKKLKEFETLVDEMLMSQRISLKKFSWKIKLGFVCCTWR